MSLQKTSLTTEQIDRYRTVCLEHLQHCIRDISPPGDGMVHTIMRELEALSRVVPIDAPIAKRMAPADELEAETRAARTMFTDYETRKAADAEMVKAELADKAAKTSGAKPYKRKEDQE